jgi:hypothetical protein
MATLMLNGNTESGIADQDCCKHALPVTAPSLPAKLPVPVPLVFLLLVPFQLAR